MQLQKQIASILATTIRVVQEHLGRSWELYICKAKIQHQNFSYFVPGQ